MVVRWQDRILVRTAVSVVGVFFLIGLLSITLITSLTGEVLQKQSQQRLSELLDTVENTASIACFVEDKQLALELARGLLKNSEIAAVTLISGANTSANTLVSEKRPQITEVAGGAKIIELSVRRPIASPFDATQIIGEIQITPHHAEIARQIQESSHFVAIVLALLLALIAAIVVMVVLHFIVRPVKAMSDNLHRLNVKAAEQLPPPKGQEKNEMGRLASDINKLISNLVTFFDLEREQHQKHSEEAAHRLATTDTLTGIANRAGLEYHLTECLPQSAVTPFTLMKVDLDNFRQINEAIGMTVGDRVLAITSSRLTTCLKDADRVARSGGDEFFIVLHGIDDPDTASRIAARIVVVLSEPIASLREDSIRVTASIGLVFCPANGTDIATLLRNVDLALDHIKTQGGNGFKCFDPSMVQVAEERHRMESDLRLSLQRNELRLYYQPIINLVDNRLAGAEALIRWQHPTRGLVPPDDFIPLAERTGLIVEIGRWVLEEACQQLAIWRAQPWGQNLYLSINVSARQIPNDLSLRLLQDTLLHHKLPTSALALEITEGTLLSDVNQGIAWLTELHRAGFRIYLDDFGTGYSSLSYLKRFPIDIVKIDRSFVRDMSENTQDRALIEAIIVMTRTLSMEIVAEGIENADQLALLRTLGGQYAQGYYFSKPVPPEAFPITCERITQLLQ
ncbi:MAG: EAL domain-containing protein [Rhodocyclaceae bacterium]|nr:EAL domain-containing protein [Rhodocyclaceae bacterium]